MSDSGHDFDQCLERFSAIETSITSLEKRLSTDWNHLNLVIKWVIFPLIVILGGLVGIKLAFP